MEFKIVMKQQEESLNPRIMSPITHYSIVRILKLMRNYQKLTMQLFLVQWKPLQ